MGNIQLIGLDLDETLLRRDKSISAHTMEVLARAHAAGLVVVPVTGRPLSGIMPEVRRIPGLTWCITSNGAVTTHLPEGRRIRERLLPRVAVRELCMLHADVAFSREIFIEDYGYCSEQTYAMHERDYAGHPFLDYIRASRSAVPELMAFIDAQPDRFENVCFVCKDLPVLDEIYAAAVAYRLEQDAPLHVTRTTPRVIEIGAPGADKGLALLALGETLGIPQEGICAVGDSDNDLGMLRTVGYPVAMGNGTEAVKALAAHITADNEHDGVAQVIEDLLASH
ncbi:MAG: HAD family phosphatase [Butyrivibrio sp.]|nr:HAD family phosphatase [Butyrivibrio sp.]